MFSYYGLVFIYDTRKDKTFHTAVKHSLKNQLLVTLPSTFCFLQWYPIEYGNMIYSLAALPVVVSGDIYFYLSHRSHSGTTMPYDSGVHHLHHKLLNCNYGTGLYIIDRITDRIKAQLPIVLLNRLSKKLI